MTVDADVTFNQRSKELDGRGLWKINIFGSKNNKGKGQRFDEKTQIASPDEQGYPLRPRNGLSFVQMQTAMDLATVGCTEVKYLCVEFMKGDRPKPNYEMIIDGGDSLISCQLRDCNMSKFE